MSTTYPILSLDEAQAYEDSILNGAVDRTAAAMKNAGEAIGRELLLDYRELSDWPKTPHVLVLAGKGLNTGDALVACETIRESIAGLTVTLVMTAAESELNPIAADVLARMTKDMGQQLKRMSVDEFSATGESCYDVVLDGLYGLGFRPPLRDKVAELLLRVNGMEGISLRVSIDLPSGMGNETDPNTFRADITYIPGVAKAPCFKEENAAFVGRIRFLEIAPFLAQPADHESLSRLASRKAFKSLNRVRPARSDKRNFGHCMIIAGSNQMPGAALMATLGALHAGAGLVTTCAPMNVATHIASSVPEAMWRPLPLTQEGSLDLETVRIVSQLATKADAMLVGPGLVLDRATVFVLCRIIREVHLPVVIDASALTQDIIAAAVGRPLNAGPILLTPHVGEFLRINMGRETAVTHKSLMGFSKKYRAITVLKGNPNLITDGDQILTAPVGGPVLARGGSGDILSGMMTTLLAQSPEKPLEAAINAVTWHAAAADMLARESGAVAVKTTDLLGYLATSLRA